MNYGWGIATWYNSTTGKEYVVVSGQTNSFTVGGGYDCLVLKLTSEGMLEWSIVFGTPELDRLEEVVIDEHGFIYAAGATERLYEVLKSTSLDLGAPGQDIRYGWGIIDAYAAVKKALEVAKLSGIKGYVYDNVDESPIQYVDVLHTTNMANSLHILRLMHQATTFYL